ncbi:hypothetical protein [Bacillus sp. 03113]|uniref:hypothetical protein n=1 Tax=Bacillus sp. 03113 TaxID=2578211 RepID=UPI0011438EB7|nr:hypothetical protein [Bacillus sp. 03113]
MIQIAGYMFYALWAVFGFMLLDFLVGLFRSLVTWTLNPKIITNYLKDIIFYVYPLIVIANILPIDPTGWILIIFYYIGAVGIIWYYITGLINKWRA